MSQPPARSAALPIVGWREWIGLPDLGVRRIKAKVDTGARSSAIHAFALEVFERDGRRIASFEIHPRQRSAKDAVRVEAEVVGERLVRSSTGHAQRRYVVNMTIALMERSWTCEVTLARRDQMGFRFLLGREALRGRFVVDPAASFVAGRLPRRRPEGGTR